MSNFITTQFHTAIATAIKTGNNVIVKAGPGSGKTTSIKHVFVPALLSLGLMSGGAIAFNYKNAMDLKAAINSPFIACSTVHSALFGCLKSFMRVKVEVASKAGFNKFKKRYMPAMPGKAEIILQAVLADKKSDFKNTGDVLRLVSLMKANALGLPGYPAINDTNAINAIISAHGLITANNDGTLPDSSELIDLAVSVFEASLKATATVDFDDQIYFALYFNAPLPDWKFLVYDEGQDIKPIELEFLKRMDARGCQLVIVGDSDQAINQFTGCLSDALTDASNMLNAQVLPLPVSYRCSFTSASLANEIFPDSVIAWEGAKQGNTFQTDFPSFVQTLQEMDNSHGILSRTHKNIMPLALQFLAKKKEFTYKGIADLVSKMERMLYHNAKKSANLVDIIRGLQEYQAELESKHVNASTGAIKPWVIAVGETTESLCGLLAYCNEQGENLDHAKQYLKQLANCDKASNGPTLSTLHASKGLQWNDVYLLGELTSALAKTEEQVRAETCLKFVGVTRSSENVHYVSL